MTRAVELAAYGVLGEWIHPNEHHRDRQYDVYYDLLNQPDAGTLGGDAWAGDFRPMLRYQMGGGRLVYEHGAAQVHVTAPQAVQVDEVSGNEGD